MNQDNIYSVLPKKLELSIGGYDGAGFTMKLQGENVVYSTFFGKDVVLKPTDRKWRNFKKKIDDIGVWDWRGEYHNPNILDGTQLELEIDYGKQIIKSYGSNLYPGAINLDSDETPEFKAFLHALSLLLGGVKI